MRKEHRTTAVSQQTYQLPEDAHTALTQTRDHLQLLARLTDPRLMDDDEDLPVSPTALAHCFARLAGDLDRIVRAAYRPGREGVAATGKRPGAVRKPSRA